MFRGVSAFLLFLSAAIPTVSAFGAPTVLPTAKHDAAAKACSSGFRSSPALRIAPAGGALLRKNLGGARAAMASDSVDVASLNSLVDAAQPSDTIVLEKGSYKVDGSIVIDKPLTIKCADGLTYRDVLIHGQSGESEDTGDVARGDTTATNRGSYMLDVKAQGVEIRGVSIFMAGGSTTSGLSAGTASIAVCVDGGSIEIRNCHLYTDTGAAVVVQGTSASAIIAQSRMGPCGWFAQSKAGYAVLTRNGGHASVLNSDLYMLSQSGVVAYQSASTAYVNRCTIGPCLLSAIAAEGMRVELQAQDVNVVDIKWREVAEFDGGEVVFLDEAGKQEEQSYQTKNSKCRPARKARADEGGDMPGIGV